MGAVERADLELSDDYTIALSKFRFAVEDRHLSQYSVKAYLAGAERFLGFLQRDIGLVLPLDKVSKEHTRKWLRSLGESDLKPATIRSHYQAARQFFKAAIEDGEIPGGDNPFDGLTMPPVEMKEISILTPEEVQAMVTAAGRDRTTNRFWGIRDAALIITLYDSGVRASEIIGIRADDIDWQAGALLIRGKGRRERRIGLGATAMRALNKYMNARKRYEVGKKWWQKPEGETSIWLSRRGGLLTTWGLTKVLERRGREAGVEKRVHAHVFRHSSATMQAEEMPESELRAHFGWSPTSPQVFRYTRSNLSQRAIARHRKNAPGDRIRL